LVRETPMTANVLGLNKVLRFTRSSSPDQKKDWNAFHYTLT